MNFFKGFYLFWGFWLQENIIGHTFSVSSSMYNPLDEPSPLGLRLRKSPSLLDLIQMKLSQDSAALGKKSNKGSSALGAADKLKASNFPASILKIGTWQVCCESGRIESISLFYFSV